MTPEGPAPQNLDAEESILGAMMLSAGAIDAVAKIIEPGDFYRPTHGTIYRAALGLHGRGEPVDAITLVDELERRGDLEQVGGMTRIHELAAIVPAASNAGHYARILRSKARERAVLRELGPVVDAARNGGVDVVDALAAIERARTVCADAERGRTLAFEGLSHADVLTREYQQERFIVEDMIPAGGIGTIAGVPETHKSFVAQAVAVRCAAGEGEILGRRVMKRTHVGYVWQDDSEREEAERVKLYETVHAAPEDVALWWFLNPGIALPGDVGRLRTTVEQLGLELLILDSFYSVAAGIDLRDQEAEQTILLLKREIADATGCTVLIVDHMPWATDTNRSRLRGYGGVHKGAAIRFGIYIDAEGQKLYVEVRGNNIQGFRKTPAYWDAEKLELRLVDADRAGHDDRLDDEVFAYVEGHPGQATSKVAAGLGKRRENVESALERLQEPGRVNRVESKSSRELGRAGTGRYWFPLNHAPSEPLILNGTGQDGSTPEPCLESDPSDPSAPRRGDGSRDESLNTLTNSPPPDGLEDEVERLEAVFEADIRPLLAEMST